MATVPARGPPTSNVAQTEYPIHAQYDIVVIGGGAAGLAASTTAVRWGAKVLLVEQSSNLGGDCTWTGCVPSKALLKCAHVAHSIKHAKQYGVVVDPAAVSVDFATVRSHWESSQRTIYDQDDSPDVIRNKGVEVCMSTRATFASRHELRLTPVVDADMNGNDVDRASRVVFASRIILAVGAHPRIPGSIAGIGDMDPATSDTIWARMTQLPRGLLILGAGPIGCELAQAFTRLGTDVTLVGTVLPRERAAAREAVSTALMADGVRLEQGRATSIARSAASAADGASPLAVLEMDGPAGHRSLTVPADVVLCAMGRSAEPALRALSVDKAGCKVDPQGRLSLDAFLRCAGAPHVFATGDCAGGEQFTHLAGYQGSVAGWNASMPRVAYLKAPGVERVPRCTFTDPEVASVGVTLREAQSRYADARETIVELSHFDRAVCDGTTVGAVSIVHRGVAGTILGASAFGKGAGEMVSELAVFSTNQLNLKALAKTLHPYPAMAQGLQMTASAAVANALQQLVDGCFFGMLRTCCCGPSLHGSKGR